MGEFLFEFGFALAFIGGLPFLLSSILGSIVVLSWPYVEISRHDQPERFDFWRRVMLVTCAAGCLCVTISRLVGR